MYYGLPFNPGEFCCTHENDRTGGEQINSKKKPLDERFASDLD